MRGVLGRVGGVDAVPDHRRLVAHRVDPGQQPRQQVGVADVAADQLVPVALRRRLVAVGLREQRVEQERLVPLGGEPVRDVGPDETGAAGDQNAHPADAIPRASARPDPSGGRKGRVTAGPSRQGRPLGTVEEPA